MSLIHVLCCSLAEELLGFVAHVYAGSFRVGQSRGAISAGLSYTGLPEDGVEGERHVQYRITVGGIVLAWSHPTVHCRHGGGALQLVGGENDSLSPLGGMLRHVYREPRNMVHETNARTNIRQESCNAMINRCSASTLQSIPFDAVFFIASDVRVVLLPERKPAAVGAARNNIAERVRTRKHAWPYNICAFVALPSFETIVPGMN